MTKVIIYIGIYLIVSAILVYQVTNPIQKEIVITPIGKSNHSINSDLPHNVGLKMGLDSSALRKGTYIYKLQLEN